MPNRKLVKHFRIYNQEGKAQCRGGVTAVYDFDSSRMAVAVCSHKDNYSKSTGRWLAEARLSKAESRGCITKGVAQLERPEDETKVPDILRAMQAVVIEHGLLSKKKKVMPGKNEASQCYEHEVFEEKDLLELSATSV